MQLALIFRPYITIISSLVASPTRYPSNDEMFALGLSFLGLSKAKSKYVILLIRLRFSMIMIRILILRSPIKSVTKITV